MEKPSGWSETIKSKYGWSSIGETEVIEKNTEYYRHIHLEDGNIVGLKGYSSLFYTNTTLVLLDSTYKPIQELDIITFTDY